jgi:hypothetical protein
MPAPRPPDLAAAVAAEVAAIAAAWERIEDLVDGHPDPPQALLVAGDAAEGVAALELPAKGLRLRGRAARRWRDRDELSLAGLGGQLEGLGLGEPGKPKTSLAQKLVRAGGPTPEEGP